MGGGSPCVILLFAAVQLTGWARRGFPPANLTARVFGSAVVAVNAAFDGGGNSRYSSPAASLDYSLKEAFCSRHFFFLIIASGASTVRI